MHLKSTVTCSSFFFPLQITVYDQEYFQGRRMEFTACCQNIMECGMENIRSLKVECGAYVELLLALENGAAFVEIMKVSLRMLFVFIFGV